MSTARTSTLANLRGRIERIETHGDTPDLNKVALGHAAADATLCGGLAVAAVHEVFAEGHQSPTATGFIAGFAGTYFSIGLIGSFTLNMTNGIGFVALAATHSFADTLFNVRYELVVALVGAEGALFGVAILACVGPLRQAVRANPVEILRAG